MATTPRKSNADFAVMRNDLDNILAEVKEMRADLKSAYATRADVMALSVRIDGAIANTVTHDQFWPVKVIVYGAVGLILTSVLGALIALVVTRGN